MLTRRRFLVAALCGVVPPLLVACGRPLVPAPDAARPIATEGPIPTVAPTPGVQPTPVPAATPTAAPAPPATVTVRPRGPLLTNPRFRRQDTLATNSLSPDGYTWAQGNPLIVDRHERIIALAQAVRREGEALIFANFFVYSNNGGSTWRDATPAIEGVARASLAYDDENDILHALWREQDPARGISYRRYLIDRDAGRQIVGIRPDPLGPVALDGQTDGSMAYEHPIIHWLPAAEFGNRYGAVLCVWSAHNGATGQGGNEVRASLRLLGGDGGDADPAGWAAPCAPSATTIGNPPVVAYTALLANRAVAPIYPSLGRARGERHQGDLYLFAADGGAGDRGESWSWRRFAWSAPARRWREATPETIISPVARSGRDRGYELKGQLGTKIVEDPQRGLVYFGFTTWKDDFAGDTWNVIAVDGDDRVGPLLDIYSCGGRFQPELYALTGDIVFDEASGNLVVAYIHSGLGANMGVLRVYDGATPIGGEYPFFTAADVDIPLLWQDSRTGRCRYGAASAPRLLALFRDTDGQVAPYRGWFGTLDWRVGS